MKPLAQQSGMRVRSFRAKVRGLLDKKDYEYLKQANPNKLEVVLSEEAITDIIEAANKIIDDPKFAQVHSPHFVKNMAKKHHVKYRVIKKYLKRGLGKRYQDLKNVNKNIQVQNLTQELKERPRLLGRKPSPQKKFAILADVQEIITKFKQNEPLPRRITQHLCTKHNIHDSTFYRILKEAEIDYSLYQRISAQQRGKYVKKMLPEYYQDMTVQLEREYNLYYQTGSFNHHIFKELSNKYSISVSGIYKYAKKILGKDKYKQLTAYCREKNHQHITSRTKLDKESAQQMIAELRQIIRAGQSDKTVNHNVVIELGRKYNIGKTSCRRYIKEALTVEEYKQLKHLNWSNNKKIAYSTEDKIIQSLRKAIKLHQSGQDINLQEIYRDIGQELNVKYLTVRAKARKLLPPQEYAYLRDKNIRFKLGDHKLNEAAINQIVTKVKNLIQQRQAGKKVRLNNAFALAEKHQVSYATIKKYLRQGLTAEEYQYYTKINRRSLGNIAYQIDQRFYTYSRQEGAVALMLEKYIDDFKIEDEINFQVKPNGEDRNRIDFLVNDTFLEWHPIILSPQGEINSSTQHDKLKSVLRRLSPDDKKIFNRRYRYILKQNYIKKRTELIHKSCYAEKKLFVATTKKELHKFICEHSHQPVKYKQFNQDFTRFIKQIENDNL